MDSWFRFGLVRGLIGIVVASIQLLAFTSVIFPTSQVVFVNQMFPSIPSPATNQTVVQMYSYLAMLPAILFLAFAAMVIISGIVYWLGARIVGDRFTGIWKAVASGVMGTLVILVILAIFVVPLTLQAPANLAMIYLASIPTALIVEVGYAVITYGFYRVMGWELPT